MGTTLNFEITYNSTVESVMKSQLSTLMMVSMMVSVLTIRRSESTEPCEPWRSNCESDDQCPMYQYCEKVLFHNCLYGLCAWYSFCYYDGNQPSINGCKRK